MTAPQNSAAEFSGGLVGPHVVISEQILSMFDGQQLDTLQYPNNPSVFRWTVNSPRPVAPRTFSSWAEKHCELARPQLKTTSRQKVAGVHLVRGTVRVETMLSRCRVINQKVVAAASCSPAASEFFSARRPRAPAVRVQPSRQSSGKRYNVPISAEFVARVSGISTMGRLPFQETADGLDAAFVGVPIDTGTSNRPGARCWKCLTLMVLNLCWGKAVTVQGAHLCTVGDMKRVFRFVFLFFFMNETVRWM